MTCVAALDHLFVLCPAGAELAAQALHRAGLAEGSRNDHPGQGTACHRFFFQNAYIELLWISDPRVAQSESTRRTRLWDRWSGLARGTCPFGIVLRPGEDVSETGCPFPSWSYRPSYLPADMSIEFATGISLEEPELIYLGFQRGGLARRSVEFAMRSSSRRWKCGYPTSTPAQARRAYSNRRGTSAFGPRRITTSC